jgi:soluble lytic murein transglycosylase-like protein
VPDPLKPSPERRPWLIVAAVALVAVLLVVEANRGGDTRPLPPTPAQPTAKPGAPGIAGVARVDPFAYRAEDDAEFLRRGRDGLAHVLYTKSPGGAEATAARTARWRGLAQKAAARYGVDASTIEAIVFVESAGRPDVEAGGNPDSAVGLAQILPGTATSLLGMRVDLPRSLRLAQRLARARRIATAARRARVRRRAQGQVAALLALRPRIDQRYDPRASLDGAARYLAFAQHKLGRPDLATASYHMGVGNLQDVIDAYVSPRPRSHSTRATVARYGITYPRLYFDSSPVRNPMAYRRLYGLGDDSRHYLFKVEAARDILRMFSSGKVDELRRIAQLQTAKASQENLLRPEDEYPPYKDGTALRRAYAKGDLVGLPDSPRRFGYTIDRGMGSLARQVHEKRTLFRGLRPEALATLIYITKEVRSAAGGSHLRVTSTVRDLKYQRALVGVNIQATREFSLHTTGYAFDIERSFRNRREAAALVATLERLRALDVIDWVYEPAAIHVTAGPEAKALVPLLDRLIVRP